MEKTLVADASIAAMIPFAVGGLFSVFGLGIGLAALVAGLVGGSFVSLRVMQIKAAQDRRSRDA